jgi:hypothetical protein
MDWGPKLMQRWQNTLKEYGALKESERIEMAKKSEKEKHKCNSCAWGSWAGDKFVCTFSHCIKENGWR